MSLLNFSRTVVLGVALTLGLALMSEGRAGDDRPEASQMNSSPDVNASIVTSGTIIIHKRLLDDKSTKWKPATPAHRWTFNVANEKGESVARPTDEDNTKLDDSQSYVVTEAVPVGFELVSFVLSEKGRSSCKDEPSSRGTSVRITPGALRGGTVHLCAYNKAVATPTPTPGVTVTTSGNPTRTVAPTTKPGLVKEFFAQRDDVIVWKLRPLTSHAYVVYDEFVSACEEFNGAACGDIAAGGYGKFYEKGSEQYLLVSQKYETKDGNCEVENHAKWESGDLHGEVEARFRCSGATALGYPLIALAALAAIVIAYGVQRRHPWTR